MTKGGPLDAPSRCRCTRTSSSASATTASPPRSATCIFLVIVLLVTAIQFRLLRKRGLTWPCTEMTASIELDDTGHGAAVSRLYPCWLYVVLPSVVIAVVPFVWMILGASRRRPRSARCPPTWWPETRRSTTTSELFGRLDFATYFFNSAHRGRRRDARATSLFCSMLGYALAKLEFRGQEARCSLACWAR